MGMKPDGYEDGVMTEIAKHCSNILKTMEEKYQKEVNKSKCSPMALIGMMCTVEGILDACPEDMQVKSEKCSKKHHMHEMEEFDHSH